MKIENALAALTAHRGDTLEMEMSILQADVATPKQSAAGALEPQQVFVVVDTPAHLEKVSAGTSGTTPDPAFRVAVGW